ncbi:MAG: CinA family nicotinamide mononucleotide deamidase-related protein [Muribaculaceae bacterium]|nr:CinA family nicotinamide mononucleotide deamidase-related protein [Muribaculaceae bacterium]
MNVSIIAIGDELLIGQVIDTNSGDIARRLNPSGWRVNDVQVVSDNSTQIKQAIDWALQSSDVVITTGGLGPTKDDITKSTLCQYFGGELKEDPAVLENVKDIFRKRGLKLNPLTAAQAIVPTSCTVIQNRVGTAPIMWFERNGKVLVAMPGVPFETRYMLDCEVIPRLLARFKSDIAIQHRTLLITDFTESLLAMTISDWEDNLPEYLHLAYLPKPGLIRLRIDGIHHDNNFLVAEIDRHYNQLQQILASHVLWDSDMQLEEILLQLLNKNGQTISTAESCTGGNIAHLITSIPGSSQSFNGGVVAYSNDVKHNILNVSQDTLNAHGAVSIPVVEQMAIGACHALATDYAIATSGIAGPGGGSAGKPVGTVCIALNTPAGVISNTYHFTGNRNRIIERASMTALIMAIKHLKRHSKNI